MPKAGELSWDELYKSKDEYKHKPTALWGAMASGGKTGGVDPLNKAEKKVKDGEVPEKPSDEEIRAAVMHNAPKQPTDEEMFGHLVVTEEMVKAAQEEWENKMNKSLQHVDIGDDTAIEWTGREPLTKDMTEEELAEWRMYYDR